MMARSGLRHLAQARKNGSTASGQTGHSLVELSVVLAVLGIALAASEPAFHRLGLTNDLMSATDQLAGRLRITRQKAVSLGVPHVLVWNEVQQLYLIFRDDNGNGLPDTGESREGPFSLPGNVNMHNSSTQGFTTSRIIFAPAGSANETGSIELTQQSGGTKLVTVLAPTGQVKVH